MRRLSFLLLLQQALPLFVVPPGDGEFFQHADQCEQSDTDSRQHHNGGENASSSRAPRGGGARRSRTTAIPFDGWTVPGAPEGASRTRTTGSSVPPTTPRRPSARSAEGSLARQPEIIDFLAGIFGLDPFSAAGGIVDDLAELGSPSRPRPARSTPLASSVTRSRATAWSCTSWPTSGSATTSPSSSGSTSGSTRGSPPTPSGSGAEREGLGTAQEIFDFFYSGIPADDPFWEVTIGDPGPG